MFSSSFCTIVAACVVGYLKEKAIVALDRKEHVYFWWGGKRNYVERGHADTFNLLRRSNCFPELLSFFPLKMFD